MLHIIRLLRPLGAGRIIFDAASSGGEAAAEKLSVLGLVRLAHI